MKPYIYIVAIIFDLAIMVCAGHFVSKIIDMWYEKKQKPKRVDINCPVSGRKLTDQELFMGSCSSCLMNTAQTVESCRLQIKHQSNVKG